ncbi:MAG: baseplate J family protein [Desulfobacteraceae bacterium 4572_35.1]|nr:MAG: baseplate J family protein [Desulfobacteraceae bacterium 4572_35.1]
MLIRELVNRSLDEIRQSLFDRINDKQEEYAAKGWLPNRLNLNKGIVRGLIEIWAWGLYQLYQFLAVVLKQAFADSATGPWLDLHCKQVDVYRKVATKAKGLIYLMRVDPVGNVPLQAGRIVRTLPDGMGQVYRFVTVADVVLIDGETEIAVEVIAEEYGQGGNVTTGQICEIVTTIDGIDTVENRADWLSSEGTNAELDPPLFERYTLAWTGLNGATKHAYEAWARSVTGVVAATILDQHPRGQGTVDVVLKGAAGMPTQALIDEVDTVIKGTGNGDEKQPINDDVLVKSPTPINVTIVAELVLTHGAPVDIEAQAEARVRAMFEQVENVSDVPPLKIGQDLPLDLLRWAVLAVDGVKKVNITSPAVDVEVAGDGLAVLQAVTLTSTWASEA